MEKLLGVQPGPRNQKLRVSQMTLYGFRDCMGPNAQLGIGSIRPLLPQSLRNVGQGVCTGSNLEKSRSQLRGMSRERSEQFRDRADGIA